MGATDTVDSPDTDSTGDSLSRIIDWITAVLCALAGLFFAALGAGMYALADHDEITEFVIEEDVQVDELTQDELVDLIVALLTWGGLGTIIVGVLLIAGGVGFLVYRRRQDRRSESPDTIALSIVGGIVTIVVSAIPFSPVLGGLVSGYLRDGTTSEGTTIGAYAGVVASIPFILLGLLAVVVFVAVALELGLGSLVFAGGFAILFGLLFALVYTVGLSALGGFLGTKLTDRNSASTDSSGDTNG